jgi:fructose-1-phosphate kinase PfkB-like protein
VLGLGSSFLAGVAMAAGKRKSWVHMVIFAGALGLALSVITDIEFPRLGFVRVNQFDQQLFHLYEMM